MPVLETDKLTKWFGGLLALTDLDLVVQDGEILGLIGPNGAGKSTALAVMSGFLSPSQGRVILNGVDITRLPPNRRVRAGLARVFQQNVLFDSCTVFESVQVGAHLHAGKGLSKRGIGPLASLRRRRESRAAAVWRVLDLVGLADDAGSLAVSLPHGKKRLLGLAIALASEAPMLLLDEPLTGMNAEETNAMVTLIGELRTSHGFSFIVVEHNMQAVMSLCDRLCVLNFGRQIACGTPAEVSQDELVVEAYLGVDADVAQGY